MLRQHLPSANTFGVKFTTEQECVKIKAVISSVNWGTRRELLIEIDTVPLRSIAFYTWEPKDYLSLLKGFTINDPSLSWLSIGTVYGPTVALNEQVLLQKIQFVHETWKDGQVTTLQEEQGKWSLWVVRRRNGRVDLLVSAFVDRFLVVFLCRRWIDDWRN